jgi:hypothetical protein
VIFWGFYVLICGFDVYQEFAIILQYTLKGSVQEGKSLSKHDADVAFNYSSWLRVCEITGIVEKTDEYTGDDFNSFWSNYDN